MVNRPGQATEERAQRGLVGGVERRDVARADVGRGLLQAVGVPAGDDDTGALPGRLAGGLQSDS
jgi:hypothetical protein